MLTAKDVAQRLAAKAESVASMLLPAGRRMGREWVAGDAQGGEGKSLKVCVSGDRAGLWSDFATGEGGDLLDLWAISHRISIGAALAEAKDYLGVMPPPFSGSSKRTYHKPERPQGLRRADGRVREYLASRGLTDETIRAFRVAANADDDEIVFPFLRDGDLVNIKYLKLERPNGKKIVRQEKDAEPCLFGWQAVPDNAREIVITEGEIDAMTWWQMGFPALSVWSGAGNMQWIETEWDRLARFDTIYLALDADDAGRAAVDEIVGRLRRSRCRIVTTPMKDANECLTSGLGPKGFAALIKAAARCDPPELRSAYSYRDEVMARLFPSSDEPPGWRTPFQGLTDKGVRFQPAELIVLNGINGHGKTSFLSEIILSICVQHGKVCIASMEVKPPTLLSRMTEQAANAPEGSVSREFALHVQDWFNGRIWMFDRVGSADGKYLLDVFRYARECYGITVFALDSLAKCGIDEDDYAAQKRFVDALCDFKNETDSTVFLVTHSRKLENEFRIVDKMDIKGSGAIADLADTVTTLWRNKKKESKPENYTEDEPDAYWYWQKNRNGDYEKIVPLWFDPRTRRFRGQSKNSARPYVAFSIIRGGRDQEES